MLTPVDMFAEAVAESRAVGENMGKPEISF